MLHQSPLARRYLSLRTGSVRLERTHHGRCPVPEVAIGSTILAAQRSRWQAIRCTPIRRICPSSLRRRRFRLHTDHDRSRLSCLSFPWLLRFRSRAATGQFKRSGTSGYATNTRLRRADRECETCDAGACLVMRQWEQQIGSSDSPCGPTGSKPCRNRHERPESIRHVARLPIQAPAFIGRASATHIARQNGFR